MTRCRPLERRPDSPSRLTINRASEGNRACGVENCKESVMLRVMRQLKMREKLALLCGLFTLGYIVSAVFLYDILASAVLPLAFYLGAATMIIGILLGWYLAWNIAH